MSKIKKIIAQEILSGIGVPTVEVTVILDSGNVGISSYPSGEGGIYDALELRDRDQKRYSGHGVLRAVANVLSPIAPMLIGKDALNQQLIDKKMIELDGTPHKSNLGANAIFSVSMAVAKAAAADSNLPLYLYLTHFLNKDPVRSSIPTPLFNLINGTIDSNTKLYDFNEFIIVPASSKSFENCLEICSSIHKSLRSLLSEKNYSVIKEYDDITTQKISSNKEAFLFLKQAIENISVRLGLDVFVGLNSKASSFYKDGKYRIKDFPSPLSSEELLNFYNELNHDLNFLYIEDAFAEDDWVGWQSLFSIYSQKSTIAGGDLTATNLDRLQLALSKKTINAIVIKPTQVGTVIESLAIAQAARAMGLKIIVSHRSNETTDDFISDFAVAVSSDYVKLGSLTRGENIAKYNRLLQINNQLKVL